LDLGGDVALFCRSPPAQTPVAEPRVQIRPLDCDDEGIAGSGALQRSGEIVVESGSDFHTPVRKLGLQVRGQKSLQMKRCKTARQPDVKEILMMARALKDF